MTERSRFWDGVATGDATEAPYDAPTEFAAVLRSLSGAAGVTTNLGGVFDNELNELAVTGATSPLSVASGRALAYGNWYESDAAVNVAIPTPAASTRIDRVVLRKDWTAQTVRITRIAGVEGGAAPALVQIAGTTWDTPLSQVSITTGGAITLTDQREFIPRANAAVHAHSSAIDGGDGPLTIADANYYSWLSANSPRIYRDAADITALRRTTNPQAFRIYNTFTDLSNYERGGFRWASNQLNIESVAAGTGTQREIVLNAAQHYFQVGGVTFWNLNTSGHLIAQTDNTPDIGSASNRVRTIYAGTALVVGTNPATVGQLRLANATSGIVGRKADNSNDLTMLILTSGNLVQIGDSNVSGVTIPIFTDVTAGGLRVAGNSTDPTGEPSEGASTQTRLALVGGSTGVTELEYWLSTTFKGKVGFNNDGNTLAGVLQTANDLAFRTAGGTRVFIDDSDSGTLVLGQGLTVDKYITWRANSGQNMRLLHSATGSRDVVFPDISGTVMLGFSKRKDADESVNNSTTLQNDDALSGAVKAGVTYSFVIELNNVVENAGGMEVKVGLDLPAGSTLQAWAILTPNNAGGTFPNSIEMVAEATGYVLTISAVAASTVNVRITGYFTVGGSDGTAQFQWAQGVAIDSAPGLTVHSGATFTALAPAN